MKHASPVHSPASRRGSSGSGLISTGGEKSALVGARGNDDQAVAAHDLGDTGGVGWAAGGEERGDVAEIGWADQRGCEHRQRAGRLGTGVDEVVDDAARDEASFTLAMPVRRQGSPHALGL